MTSAASETPSQCCNADDNDDALQICQRMPDSMTVLCALRRQQQPVSPYCFCATSLKLHRLLLFMQQSWDNETAPGVALLEASAYPVIKL